VGAQVLSQARAKLLGHAGLFETVVRSGLHPVDTQRVLAAFAQAVSAGSLSQARAWALFQGRQDASLDQQQLPGASPTDGSVVLQFGGQVCAA
jgi:hypothetical protein